MHIILTWRFLFKTASLLDELASFIILFGEKFTYKSEKLKSIQLDKSIK